VGQFEVVTQYYTDNSGRRGLSRAGYGSYGLRFCRRGLRISWRLTA